MGSITATALPDGLSVEIVAALSDSQFQPGSVITIVRRDAIHETETIIASWIREGTDEDVRQIIDAGTPLQRETRWRLIGTEPSSAPVIAAISQPVTLTASGCWLTYGPYPHASLQVEVQAWPQDDLTPRESVHRVLRRRDVVPLQDVWDLPAGDITFLTRDLAATDAVTAALTAGGKCLLRTQPDSLITNGTAGDGDGAWWFTVGSVGRARLSGRSPDGRRLVTASTRGSVPYAPGPGSRITTLEQLAANAENLFFLALFGATLGDLAALEP